MAPSNADPASVPLREDFQPSLRALVVTIVAVASTYLFFLIFAQFGFLRTVQTMVESKGALVRPIMAVMGVSGIAGSIFVARMFTERRARPLVLAGFGLGVVATGLSLVAETPTWLFLCAVLTGWCTGIVTVGLATMLRREVGVGKLGFCLGAGTGLAYGLCNLPVLFNAGVTGQAFTGMVACGVGGIALLGFEQRAPQREMDGFDYRRVGTIGWVAVFFALVWLDSAAFYVIQHTPVLKSGTWGADPQLYLNAVVHAAAALLAGQLLDRRWLVGTVSLAVVLLLAACILLGDGPGVAATAGFFYAAGVSFYSTALVFYPALSGRVGVAALVYAVAGWGGSALGVSMAENLGAVPVWFIAAAGGVILCLLMGRTWLTWGHRRSIVGGSLVPLLALVWPEADLPAQGNVDAGRKVYIAEGCIHCHAQYVRPVVPDSRLGTAGI